MPFSVSFLTANNERKSNRNGITSDLELPVADAFTHYRNRWKIETAFRDAKQNFGFGTYQVRKRESLNRHVQLSFIAASLIQFCCLNAMTDGDS